MSVWLMELPGNKAVILEAQSMREAQYELSRVFGEPRSRPYMMMSHEAAVKQAKVFGLRLVPKEADQK